jgi:hypothetical protein
MKEGESDKRRRRRRRKRRKEKNRKGKKSVGAHAFVRKRRGPRL